MVRIRCVVERITFQNPENGYSVLKVRVKDSRELVPVVGNFLDVNVGSVLLLEGDWKMDARYGQQFVPSRWEFVVPASTYGIEKYLGSGMIKGIGPKYAKRIVEAFGTETIEVIEDDVQRLLEIPGIGEKRIQKIKESWERQKEVKNIMLFLQDHGVNTSYATKIYKQYGNESIAKIQENPYRMADEIWGIGFKTADMIGEKLGVPKESFARIRGGLMYTLNRLSGEGHVFARKSQLVREAAELLEAEEESIETALDKMIANRDLILERLEQQEDAIYLPIFYYAEAGVEKKLKKQANTSAADFMPKEIDVAEIESSIRMRYDDVQRNAICQAAVSKVMVLTGGPGTGKTTTTQGIIAAYRTYGLRILLAAQTGRAAKRMTEATGLEAKTIHRLLEFKPPNGYQKNEENPLQGDALIVDECSMIDIALMNALLKAMPVTMRLILVGDVDQLPSVGAGNVLRDIIDSGEVPVIRLTRIFRQAQASRIVMNAHRVNAGEMPNISNGKTTDFFFIGKTDNEAAAEIVELVKTKLPRYYQVPPSQIQVLTPMQKGTIGAANLNQILQEALNPAGEALRHGGYVFRAGDKVMQIRNNYDKDVFNGDIGLIAGVNTEDSSLTVDFDGRRIEYDIMELDELVLAYATTIHKAQGSEYPIVVIPVSTSHYVMLQRNLLYTGITRAKKICVLVGMEKALSIAVRTVTVTKRNTLLKERLSGTVNNKPALQLGDVPLIMAPVVNIGSPKYDQLFSRLERSKFRSRFQLGEKEYRYIQEKGMNTIRKHATDFIATRLAPAEIPNDGKQTPMKGHPVFIGQHATATCCRDCLEKWHKIPKGRELSPSEQAYIVDVLMEWIRRNLHQ